MTWVQGTRRQPLEAPVLVLNRLYRPVRLSTGWQAICMLYAGRALALDGRYESHDFASWCRRRPEPDDELVGTSRGPIAVPRLLLLPRFERCPQGPLRLSRRNVFVRDDHRCQYCGRRLPPRELDLDHVLPRARGGRSTWDNVVTSCRACNLRKGMRTPQQAGMPLRRTPGPPSWSVLLRFVRRERRFALWEPFLQDGGRRLEPSHSCAESEPLEPMPRRVRSC